MTWVYPTDWASADATKVADVSTKARVVIEPTQSEALIRTRTLFSFARLDS
jgi:hypothetical protein